MNKIIPASNKFSEALYSSQDDVVKNDGGLLWRVWSEKASWGGDPREWASSTDVIDLVCMKEKTFKVTALGDTTQVLIRIHLSQALVCSLIVISTVLGN